jgi:hypothetical protein
MIGKVVFEEGELILDDDGIVVCDDDTIRQIYEHKLEMYRRDVYSPATGPFGVYFLHQTAKELKGTVEIPKRKQSDENTIY